MKALIFERVGEPVDVLRTADIPAPRLSGQDALIRVAARPIQPADLAFIKGQYRLRPTLPQTAGLEGAGVVAEASPGAAIAAGARVAFRNPGVWAEFVAAPTARLIPVPAGVSDQVACQMSLNPITAWALMREAAAESGDMILVTAASSTVGNIVGAIARRRGIRVIGLVRGDPAAARLRCTADYILSTDHSFLPEDIAAIASEQGVQALLDSVGGPLAARLFTTLKPGARIIAYGVQDSSAAAVTNAMLIYSNLTWMGFGIDRCLLRLGPGETDRMHHDLWSMVRDGDLRLPVASTYSLDAIRDALEANAASRRTGKVLLVSTKSDTEEWQKEDRRSRVEIARSRLCNLS